MASGFRRLPTAGFHETSTARPPSSLLGIHVTVFIGNTAIIYGYNYENMHQYLLMALSAGILSPFTLWSVLW